MLRVLVPVDGSEVSLRAVRHVAGLAGARVDLDVHLLNVQSPLPSAAADFISRQDIHSFHREEGEKALREAQAMLDGAGVRYECHIAVGDIAETVAGYASEKECHQIVMGSRGLSPIPNLLLGSVTTKVLHLAHVPVTIVR